MRRVVDELVFQDIEENLDAVTADDPRDVPGSPIWIPTIRHTVFDLCFVDNHFGCGTTL